MLSYPIPPLTLILLFFLSYIKQRVFPRLAYLAEDIMANGTESLNNNNLMGTMVEPLPLSPEFHRSQLFP